jgi:Abnormal spindle-like microcephaly-assoc'd, ASPM-SPD-2-Hydin
VATLTLQSTSVSFGVMALNTPSYQSVTLTSSGTAPLTISAGGLTGTGFSMSGISYPLTLSPGQTAQLQIEFDPTAAGAASGKVTLTSNCSTGTASTISLSGTGGTATTSYQVSLSWSAPGSSPVGVTGYNIHRATGSSASYQLINSSANASTSYTDPTVASSTSYSYYVESVDAAGGQSIPSNSYAVSVP